MDDVPNKTQLGKILLKRKPIAPGETDQPWDDQSNGASERPASLEEQERILDATRLLTALSEQKGVPALDLETLEIPLANLEFVPRDVAARHLILPAVIEQDGIWLAMANPDDRRVIEEIAFVTGKKVYPHIALHGQIVACIAHCYEAKQRGETVVRGSRFDPRNSVHARRPPSALPPGDGPRRQLSPEREPSVEIEFDFEFDAEPTATYAPMPAAPEVAPHMDGAETDRISRKKRVLVIDDEEEIRLLISRVLIDKGYDVVTAGRGLDAIAKIQTERPDMIVLDAMLPEVHGFDICKKLKSSERYKHIPVIMISAVYRGWRYAQDLKDSYGVDEFVEKPFKIADLIERVEAIFRKGDEHEDAPLDDEQLPLQTAELLRQSVEVYKAGDIDRAIELLQSGIAIDPLAYKLHYNLGLLLGKKALVYQAIRELESTLELAPGYFPALKNLARLYRKAGFKLKATETWERALRHCEDDAARDEIKRHLLEML